MAKHIMARRTAATESYKQIAEIASQNGFNRVVEHLNSQSNQYDNSYLWELDREKGEWKQSEAQIRAKLVEPCSELRHYTDYTTRSIINGGELTGSQSLIQDGRNYAVQKHYQLAEQRLIKSQGKANEALLSIDGYTTNSQGSLLNRSRVTRRFELKEVVGTEGDYAVIAAKHLQLRNSSIRGEGSILWLDDSRKSHSNRFRSSSQCSNGSIGSSTRTYNWDTRNRVWPIRNKSIPVGLFSGEIDKHPRRSGTRVWDIHSNPRNRPCSSGVCVSWKSGSQSGSWEDAESYGYAHVERTRPWDRRSEARKISIHAEQLCGNNQQKACELNINALSLTNNATLIIETKSSRGPRPVLLGISNQAEVDIQYGQLCQAAYSRQSSGPQNCDAKPDPTNLIVVSRAGQNEITDCNSYRRPILKIRGSALPAAVVAMPGGAVHATSSTTINGILWADSICANQAITLDTSSKNNSNKSLIKDFRDKWDPSDTQAFGRIVNRAIRGTGLDSFQQW